LQEMQGVYCGNRPMRISTATPKNKSGGGGNMANMGAGGHMVAPMGGHQLAPPMGGGYGGGMAPPPIPYYQGQQPMNQFTDPNNTTVFVGGLSGYVTEDELRSFFQGFGEITYVKIPPGKGCGFVQFVQRHAAEMAINQMQGYPIGNSRVRLSWGRSQNNSGPAGSPYRPAPPPPHSFPGMAGGMAGGMGGAMGPYAGFVRDSSSSISTTQSPFYVYQPGATTTAAAATTTPQPLTALSHLARDHSNTQVSSASSISIPSPFLHQEQPAELAPPPTYNPTPFNYQSFYGSENN